MVWLGFLHVPSWALLPSHILGILMGCDGANCLLHYCFWPTCWLRLFPHHLKGPDISGLHGEAVFVEAEKALCRAEVQYGEVHGVAEAL